jgi:hypothetical protein
MANPAADQLAHSLFWIIAPVMIVLGIVGILLGEARRWVERKADRLGQSIKKARALRVASDDVATAPHCPLCNSVMVRRTAKRGANAGSDFWGCPGYPNYRGTRET